MRFNKEIPKKSQLLQIYQYLYSIWRCKTKEYLYKQYINYTWTRNGKKSMNESHIRHDSLKRDSGVMCKLQAQSKHICCSPAFYQDSTSVPAYILKAHFTILTSQFMETAKHENCPPSWVRNLLAEIQICINENKNLALFGKTRNCTLTIPALQLLLLELRDKETSSLTYINILNERIMKYILHNWGLPVSSLIWH